MSESKGTSSLGSKEEKMMKRKKNSDTEEEDEEETVCGSPSTDDHQKASAIAKSDQKGKAAMSSENQDHDHDQSSTVTPDSNPRQNGDKELKGKATSAALNIHDQSDENTSQSAMHQLNVDKESQGEDTSAASNIHDQSDENTSKTDIKAQFNAENFLFRKSLTQSDLCLSSAKLIIPKEDAETHFPHIRTAVSKQKITEFRDEKNRKWMTIVTYYVSRDTYAIACGWYTFLKNHQHLQEGDLIEFYKPDQPQKNKYYLIQCKKAEDQSNEQGNKQGGGKKTSTGESKSKGVDAENKKAASVERKTMTLMGQTFTVEVPLGDKSGEGKSKGVDAENEKAASVERETVTLMGQTFKVEAPQGDESGEGSKTTTLMGQTLTVEAPQGDESGEGKPKKI